MKKTVISIFILFVCLIIIGCSKEYRTYKNIYGEYTLIAYNINGVDSLSLYKDSLGTSSSFYNSKKEKLDIWKIYGKRNDGIEKYLFFYWQLKENNRLVITEVLGNAIGTGIFKGYINSEWYIINLNKKELDLTSTYNDIEYSIKLIKN
jgi:hypothetical protein